MSLQSPSMFTHPGFLLTFEEGSTVCKSPASPSPHLGFLGTLEGQLSLITEQVTEARDLTCWHEVAQPVVIRYLMWPFPHYVMSMEWDSVD